MSPILRRASAPPHRALSHPNACPRFASRSELAARAGELLEAGPTFQEATGPAPAPQPWSGLYGLLEHHQHGHGHASFSTGHPTGGAIGHHRREPGSNASSELQSPGSGALGSLLQGALTAAAGMVHRALGRVAPRSRASAGEAHAPRMAQIASESTISHLGTALRLRPGSPAAARSGSRSMSHTGDRRDAGARDSVGGGETSPLGRGARAAGRWMSDSGGLGQAEAEAGAEEEREGGWAGGDEEGLTRSQSDQLGNVEAWRRSMEHGADAGAFANAGRSSEPGQGQGTGSVDVLAR